MGGHSILEEVVDVLNIGSGFYKMFKGWTSYYKRRPKAEGDFDYYKITFYIEKKAELRARVTEKVTEKVTENQKRIIVEMQKNQYITVMELQEIIGISRKSILENIAKLRNSGDTTLNADSKR